MMAGQKIMELKSNHIPKGLVPLEMFFNNNDVYKQVSNKGESQDTLDCNIGTDVHSKFVKISSKLEEK